MSIKTNLGPATAYGEAVANGYRGTKEEFGQNMADFAGAANQVALDRAAVEKAKKSVDESQADVTRKQESVTQSEMNVNESRTHIDREIAAFDAHIEEKTQEAKSAIDTTEKAATDNVKIQETASVENVKNQTSAYITEQEKFAKQNITDHVNTEIDRANEAMSQAKQTLDGTINTAISAKQALADVIDTAAQKKTELDTSNTAAAETIGVTRKLKNDLDESRRAAENTKTALDESDSAAKQTKTALDASNDTASKLNTNLTEKIAEGNQLKTDLPSLSAKEAKKVTDEATKQMGLLSAEGKKQLDAVNIAAQEILLDRQQITKNKEDIAALKGYITEAVIPTTWGAVVSTIKTGLHREMYAIGDKFTSIWKDLNADMKEYDNPWRINHFQDGAELKNGELINGMWLQTQYAQLKGVQFSHPRAFLRCPNGLVPGTYYFTIESNWGDNVKAGDVVCFTLAKDVPVGGRISGCHGAPDRVKNNWRIYSYSADGKTVIETVTPTFAVPETGTNLGIQKNSSRNGNLNSTHEMAYGWNRWKTSAIRQYLNSDKPKNEWWTAQDDWDIAPDQLPQIDGYLRGIDPELLAVIQPVKIISYANTVNDGGAEDTTYDRVILPSLEQMYIAPQIRGEGEAHQYYKTLNGTENPYRQCNTYPELITYAIENHSSAQYVRLRSASRGDACSTWLVSPSGYVIYTSASTAFRPSPLVFIGASAISAPTDAE